MSSTTSIRPLYRVEYDALVEQGFLVDEPIELIEGQLLARSPEGDRHATVIRRLTRLLVEAIPAAEGDIGVGNPACRVWHTTRHESTAASTRRPLLPRERRAQRRHRQR